MTKHNLTLTAREICDLELILNQGFAPLSTFLNQKDYQSVLSNTTLTDGTVWPMPIMLSIDQKMADTIQLGEQICLRDAEFYPLAVITVAEIWQPNKQQEAQAVFATTDDTHPGVHYLLHQTKSHYISGPLQPIQLPKHYDFSDLRKTPNQLKTFFKEHGWNQIVGFQTRNPMHRAHVELTRRAAEQINGHLLIHPVVGLTKPGDIDHFTRVKCYKRLINRYPNKLATLSLLPLAMRMAGPKEALWHAIIRKNYGCTHFIVGRDHAGPGNDKHGQPFYDPYAAQDIVQRYENQIGITMVPFQEMVFVANKQTYLPINETTDQDDVQRISGTQFREKLRNDQPIPEWFSYPEVIRELKAAYPPKHQQGLTILFTGLSGAGKSTLANALMLKLMEMDQRPITLLDGDIIRQNLSQELGFSKAHRDMNVLRIGFVAALIAKSRGIALCAPIAPYANIRQQLRHQSTEHGQFIEIYVSTPLSTCEERDTKGLYAKARQGLIKNFTGIDDPYEPPQHPEITLDTTSMTIEQSLDTIVSYLADKHYILDHHEIKATRQPDELIA